MSLRSTLTELAQTFATNVLDAIRQMSLDEILAETQGGGRAAARARAVAVAAALGAAAPVRGARRKGGRLLRRSADDIAALVDAIVDVLERTPDGLRAEEIRASLGLEAKELPRPLAEALATKRISKQGQKRATTYFARGAKGKAGGAKKKAGRSAKKRGGRKAAAANGSSTANGAPMA
jgi:hypothetical protein